MLGADCPVRVIVVQRSTLSPRDAAFLQTWKLSKALAERGVEVVVVTSDPVRARVTPAPEFLRPDIPRLTVVRARDGFAPRDSLRLLDRIRDRLAADFHSVNSLSSWVRAATRAAVQAAAQPGKTIVLSVALPFESHFVGSGVAQQLGRPWIASFTDAWPPHLLPAPYRRRALPGVARLKVNRLREVLAGCDRVHAPSRHQLEFFARMTGVDLAGKSAQIPHIGTRPATPPAPETPNRNLLYLGSLQKERVSQPLFEALKKFKRDHAERFGKLLVVGKACPEFSELARRMGVAELIELAGAVPYDKVNDLARTSGALLNIDVGDDFSLFYPGKFSDYAVSGRPILAITPRRSSVRDYLDEFGGGVAVLNDAGQIYDALLRVFGGGERWDYARLAEQFLADTVVQRYRELFTAAAEARAARS